MRKPGCPPRRRWPRPAMWHPTRRTSRSSHSALPSPPAPAASTGAGSAARSSDRVLPATALAAVVALAIAVPQLDDPRENRDSDVAVIVELVDEANERFEQAAGAPTTRPVTRCSPRRANSWRRRRPKPRTSLPIRGAHRRLAAHQDRPTRAACGRSRDAARGGQHDDVHQFEHHVDHHVDDDDNAAFGHHDHHQRAADDVHHDSWAHHHDATGHDHDYRAVGRQRPRRRPPPVAPSRTRDGSCTKRAGIIAGSRL